MLDRKPHPAEEREQVYFLGAEEHYEPEYVVTPDVGRDAGSSLESS
jgi:hypothetical protein